MIVNKQYKEFAFIIITTQPEYNNMSSSLLTFDIPKKANIHYYAPGAVIYNYFDTKSLKASRGNLHYYAAGTVVHNYFDAGTKTFNDPTTDLTTTASTQ